MSCAKGESVVSKHEETDIKALKKKLINAEAAFEVYRSMVHTLANYSELDVSTELFGEEMKKLEILGFPWLTTEEE